MQVFYWDKLYTAGLREGGRWTTVTRIAVAEPRSGNDRATFCVDFEDDAPLGPRDRVQKIKSGDGPRLRGQPMLRLDFYRLFVSSVAPRPAPNVAAVAANV